MSPPAALCIPIEIAPTGRGGARVFRIARAIVPFRLSLADGLPDEPEWLRGPLALRFHLPGAAQPIACEARAVEVVLDEGRETERAARASLELKGLVPEAAASIERYVEERLQLT